jgi:hypothetical protein
MPSTLFICSPLVAPILGSWKYVTNSRGTLKLDSSSQSPNYPYKSNEPGDIYHLSSTSSVLNGNNVNSP